MNRSRSEPFDRVILSGRDLAPLPHESLWATLSRLGWLNAFSASELGALCCRGKAPGKDLLLADWVNSPLIAQTVGWRLPGRPEAAISEQLGATAATWFSTRLRICPFCLEHWYHSHWFQLRALKHCPLHNCQLVEQCQSCGASLPDYRFGSSHFDDPFCCRECRAPIAGTPLDLEMHWELRARVHELDVLSPFGQWLDRATTAPLGFLKANHGGTWDWCRPEELRFAVADVQAPLPPACARSLYGNICLHRWRVRMRSAAFPKPGYVEFPPLTWVLRTVLRRLVRWLLESVPFADLQPSAAPPLVGELDVRDWRPAVLAFHLFRQIFCVTTRAPSGEASELWSYSLRKLPDLGITYWDHRLPRAGFRALLFGLYAGLYHLVTRAKRTGTLRLRGLREVDLVAFHWFIDRDGVAIGNVAYPPIEGLPISGTAKRDCPSGPPDSSRSRPWFTGDDRWMVRFERFRPPTELDGRYGRFRYPRKLCRIQADTDLDAIRLWFEHPYNVLSVGRHQMAIERLLEWAYVERGKAFSSLSLDDFEAYAEFLAMPQPGGRSVGLGWEAGRDHLTQRPVSQRLDDHERSKPLSTLASLAEWLDEARYCRLIVRRRDSMKVEVFRLPYELEGITTVGWTAVETALRVSGTRTLDDLLVSLAMRLMYYGALAISEIGQLCLGDFSDARPATVLIRGRPPQRAAVYLLPPLIATVAELRQCLQETTLPEGRQVGQTRLYSSARNAESYVKAGFRRAAQWAYLAGDEETALRFSAMGPAHLREAIFRHVDDVKCRGWLKILLGCKGVQDRPSLSQGQFDYIASALPLPWRPVGCGQAGRAP